MVNLITWIPILGYRLADNAVFQIPRQPLNISFPNVQELLLMENKRKFVNVSSFHVGHYGNQIRCHEFWEFICSSVKARREELLFY